MIWIWGFFKLSNLRSITWASLAIDISSSSDLFGEGEEKVIHSEFNSQATISTWVAKFCKSASRLIVSACHNAQSKWGDSPTTHSAGFTYSSFDI